MATNKTKATNKCPCPSFGREMHPTRRCLVCSEFNKSKKQEKIQRDWC